jgi:hypothetical protein
MTAVLPRPAGLTNLVLIEYERDKDKMARWLLPPSGALHRIGAIADEERSGSPIRLILQRSRRLYSRSLASASSCSQRRSAIADSYEKNGAKAAMIGARSRSRRATVCVFIVNGLMLSARPFDKAICMDTLKIALRGNPLSEPRALPASHSVCPCIAP